MTSSSPLRRAHLEAASRHAAHAKRVLLEVDDPPFPQGAFEARTHDAAARLHRRLADLGHDREQYDRVAGQLVRLLAGATTFPKAP